MFCYCFVSMHKAEWVVGIQEKDKSSFNCVRGILGKSAMILVLNVQLMMDYLVTFWFNMSIPNMAFICLVSNNDGTK
jgi:hypothetical protein